MARPKEFIQEEALEKAIDVFARHGFAGTSTDTLRKAMGLSRQSMYDTFGDKRQLYLEALRRYNAHSVSIIIRALLHTKEALRGLEIALETFMSRVTVDNDFGCLGLSSVCEFGISDADVYAINEASSRALLVAIEQTIARGQLHGDVSADIDIQEAAQFVCMSFSGLKIAATAGASKESMQGMIKMVLRSLR